MENDSNAGLNGPETERRDVERTMGDIATRREDRTPITDILRQTPDLPPNSQWAVFLDVDLRRGSALCQAPARAARLRESVAERHQRRRRRR